MAKVATSKKTIAVTPNNLRDIFQKGAKAITTVATTLGNAAVNAVDAINTQIDKDISNLPLMQEEIHQNNVAEAPITSEPTVFTEEQAEVIPPAPEPVEQNMFDPAPTNAQVIENEPIANTNNYDLDQMFTEIKEGINNIIDEIKQKYNDVSVKTEQQDQNQAKEALFNEFDVNNAVQANPVEPTMQAVTPQPVQPQVNQATPVSPVNEPVNQEVNIFDNPTMGM